MDMQQPQGILNAAQGAQPQPSPQGAQLQGGSNLPPPNPEIMSPIVQEHMDELEKMRELMQGKTGEAYDRVLTAGMKMLYAPENAETMNSLIDAPDVPMANKLGEGVANLLIMMDNTGNGTIPKEVIIPVGVSLIFEVADYLFEIGVDVLEKDLGDSLEIMMKSVFMGYGFDDAQLNDYIDKLGKHLGFEEGADAEAAEPAQVEGAEGEAAFNEGFNSQPQVGQE